MFLFNVSKKDLRSKKVSIFFLLVLFVLGIFTYGTFFVFNKLNLSLTKDESYSLEASTYYAEYDETVISNKTINTYSVKEWYDTDKYKFEYLDRVGNKFYTIKKGNKLVVYNDNEKNKLTLDTPIKENNIASFSSIANLYKQISKGENKCECKYEINKTEKNIFVIFNKCKNDNINCVLNNFLNKNNLSKIKVEISVKTGLPEIYTAFDENKKERICIVYNKFEVNQKIDENIFE
ncbi:MAG: hypothetical protein IKV94_01735 [Clostridia bacterium]|nr:hypothetical protein [Clostridia bacterium]